jgi:short-subunit dehydrogenase
MAEKPVILITGASSGIGAATALYFAQRGYRVVMAARRLERLDEQASVIKNNGGEALAIEVDVSSSEQIQELVERTLKNYSRIDVLFNNAGFGRMRWLEKLDFEADIESQLQVNLHGAIRTTKAVIPTMIAQRSGHIINMSSVAGYIAPPTYTIYAATKFGLRGFTDALRREMYHYNIRVSGIYPGPVKTEFIEHMGERKKVWFQNPYLGGADF